MAVTAALLSSCGGAKTTTAEADKFDYTVEQFADLQIPERGCSGRTGHLIRSKWKV